MVLSEGVYELAEKFMTNPVYVSINFENLAYLCDKLKGETPPKFPTVESDNIPKTVLLELIGGSINYCYWYGRDDVRPGGASSSFMYENLQNTFFNYNFSNPMMLEACIEAFIETLTFKRFPLLEERSKHLKELIPYADKYVDLIISGERNDIEPYLNILLSSFPGYASDMFLKRASLFFLQLYRNFGWFKETIKDLHIPADYQIPKIMNSERLIEYDTELSYEIDTRRPIAKWSQKE